MNSISEIKDNLISSNSVHTNSGDTKKNTLISTSITIFRGLVGLGIMTNPIFFSDSGWLLGSIVTILIAFLLAYNMIIMNKVAEDVEQEDEKAEINQIEDLLKYLFTNKISIEVMRIVIYLSTFLASYFIVIINTTNLARYLKIKLGTLSDNELFRDFSFYAFLMILILIVLIYIISDPSKLKVK